MSILIVGLTGQTGAGKSTVAAKLREKGLCIIDGDVAAREIMVPGSSVLTTLAAEFGNDILNKDGSLNRKLLASRAFANRENTLKLNGITHPVITRLVKKKIKEAEKRGARAAVIDAAALLESGIAPLCELIAVITAPEEERLGRIMRRDKLSRAEALKRVGAQLDEDWYRSHADIVLSTYPPEKADSEVERLIALIDEKTNKFR